MNGNSIAARSRPALRATARLAVWATAGALVLLSTSARAQGLFYLFEPSPQRIERQLEAGGYELRGPLIRRGDVYVGDVVADSGMRERLVIDARTARILERFPTRADRWREDRFGDWRDRDAEAPWDAPPLPPRGMAEAPDDQSSLRGNSDIPPSTRPKAHDDVVRADPGGKPTVIYGDDGLNGPSTSTVDGDKPAKTKPRAIKKKPAVARATSPSEGAATAATPGTSPAATPAVAPPVGESEKPSAPPAKMQADAPNPIPSAPPDGRPVTVEKPGADAAEQKPAAETKPAADERPVAEAKTSPPSQPRPEKKSKVVNDVPVNPLD